MSYKDANEKFLAKLAAAALSAAAVLCLAGAPILLIPAVILALISAGSYGKHLGGGRR